MGERSSGRITIGGNVPEALFPELREWCLEADLKEEWSDDRPFFEAIKLPEDLRESVKSGGHLVLMDAEASGGMFEDLETWLRQNNIPFDRHSTGASGAYDAELVMFRPGMEAPITFPSTDSGYEPLVSAFPVIEAYRHLREGNIHSAMTHLANEVGHLQSIPTLPPFQLVA
jgi:hypothetical protein